MRAANKPEFVTGIGQELWKIHSEEKCTGRLCDIHNPPTGPEAECPTYWRSDRGIMERICEHGVGHPSTAQMLFFAEKDQINGTDYARYEGIHGCDGCCGGWSNE